MPLFFYTYRAQKALLLYFHHMQLHGQFFGLLITVVLLIQSCANPSTSKRNGALEALQLQASQRAFPNQELPGPAFYQASQIIENKFRKRSSLRSNNSWKAIGPWNTSGRILCLAINPEDHNDLIVGSASGGLWRSRDFGRDTSWKRIETGFPVLGVSAVTFSHSDSNHLFIGTGEVYNFERSGTGAAYRSTRGTPGIGILHSSDGGKSWGMSLDWTYDQNRGVNDIEMHPRLDSFVVAATTHGVYISDDLGSSWKMSLDVSMVMDVACHPQKRDWILAACGNFNSAKKGIYLSRDRGDTWIKTSISPPIDFNGKIRLDYSLSNPDVVYASVGDSFDPANTEVSWILRSEDGGLSWTVQTDENFARYQGWFAHDIAVHPLHHDVITVIGIYAYQSFDGGETLTQITNNTQVTQGKPPVSGADGPPGYMHVDYHAVMYHPQDPNVLVFANDGGVFVSEDGGITFESRNGGLQTAQFYNGVSVAQFDSNKIFGGLQDNNSVLFDGDKAWTRTLAGDGSWSSIHPVDQSIIGSLQFMTVYRTNNDGDRWNLVLSTNQGDEACFISPVVRSESDPEIMYAGCSRIYKSPDGGRTWNPTNRSLPINANDPAFSLAISPRDPNLVICGLAPYSGSSSLWRSLDGGLNWQQMGQSQLPNRYPTDLIIHPKDDAIMYACFSGYHSGHVFRSEDYGENWQDITGSLPDLPVNAIAIDPDYPENVYIGNDLTVFVSYDDGQNWTIWDEGLPEALLVADLQIHHSSRQLLLATHGNGMYKRDLDERISTSADLHLNTTATSRIYPNPIIHASGMLAASDEALSLDAELVDINGQVVEVKLKPLPDNQYSFFLPSNTPNGVYQLCLIFSHGKQCFSFLNQSNE